MTTLELASLIDEVHETTNGAYYGLFADLDIRDLESLREWLMTNDPNGEYDDSAEFGRLTAAEARSIIARQIEDLLPAGNSAPCPDCRIPGCSTAH